MRLYLLAIVAIVIGMLNWATPAHAVYDVSPRLIPGLGRLATYGYDDAVAFPNAVTSKVQRVFSYIFGDQADPYMDTNPGVRAATTTSGYTPSGLPQGSYLSFDVLSDLQYWNGTGAVSFAAVPAGETLRLTLGSSVTVGTGPGYYAGFQIGNVDALQGFHKHFASELNAGSNATPADGVYLFEMHLRLLQSDGVTPYPGVDFSLPFFMMYDNNESLSAFQTAQTWVTNNLVPFGDFNRDQTTNAADIPAMMQALANLNSFKANNQLNDFDLMAFGDINGDRKINGADLQALVNFLKSGSTALSVPEPSSAMMLGILALTSFVVWLWLGIGRTRA